uniref:ATP-dependent DNA helicase n=1 Tax=Lactuca sativa TaxID=4236 RepID=A0A9R1UEE5_LACSA|nr:hypothetical protein LSAT_V11C900497200 [Lactuca sativa]
MRNKPRSKQLGFACAHSKVLMAHYSYLQEGLLIPDLTYRSTCKKGQHKSLLATLLEPTSIIIWDEASMTDKHCFECLDCSLRDILECDNKLFGGMAILVGGDFRQTLPISPKSSRSQIVSLTLPNSYLWQCFTVYNLNHNMRLLGGNSHFTSDFSVSTFASWLLKVGDGELGHSDVTDTTDTKWIDIPSSLIIPPGEAALQSLVCFVYGNDILTEPSPTALSERAIIFPTNKTTHHINDFILNISPGSATTYKSVDSIESNGHQTFQFESFYPPEYLNELNFSGVPPHILLLKVNTPIMLVRNLNQREGLYNGTCLMVSHLLPMLIEATIIIGTSIGKRVYLPCIKFIYKSSDLPFTFIRKQYPIKPGLISEKIGIYIPEPVFAHGQLYVALSCATSPDSIRILIESHANTPQNKTKNIVFKDLLRRIDTNEELQYGSPGTKLEARILRTWKPQQRTYETWYLAVDKYGDAIQISGQRKDQGYVESVLKVSKCYTLSKYGCAEPDSFPKWIDNEIYIAIPDFVDQSPDFVGIFVKFRDCLKKNKEPFLLLILRNDFLRRDCTYVSDKFNHAAIENTVGPTVIAVTNVKIAPVAGSLMLGTTSASYVYINPPIAETTTLLNRHLVQLTDVEGNNIHKSAIPTTPPPTIGLPSKTTDNHPTSSSNSPQSKVRRNLTYEHPDKKETPPSAKHPRHPH